MFLDTLAKPRCYDLYRLAYLGKRLVCSLSCSVGIHTKLSVHKTSGKNSLAFLEAVDEVWLCSKVTLAHQFNAVVIRDRRECLVSLAPSCPYPATERGQVIIIVVIIIFLLLFPSCEIGRPSIGVEDVL